MRTLILLFLTLLPIVTVAQDIPHPDAWREVFTMLNRRYNLEGEHGRSYYEFVNDLEQSRKLPPAQAKLLRQCATLNKFRSVVYQQGQLTPSIHPYNPVWPAENLTRYRQLQCTTTNLIETLNQLPAHETIVAIIPIHNNTQLKQSGDTISGTYIANQVLVILEDTLATRRIREQQIK